MNHKPCVFMTHSKNTLKDNDLKILHRPFIKIEPLKFNTSIFDVNYDWVILTSQNSVDILKPYLNQLKFKKIASIGTKTSDRLKSIGLNVDFQAPKFTQEGFIQSFNPQKKDTILYFASQNRRRQLENYLNQLDVKLTVVDAYKPSPNETSIQFFLNHLKEIDVVTFASPSAVHALFNYATVNMILNENIKVVSIGPVTHKVLVQYGVNNVYPDTYTTRSMITMIKNEVEL